MKCKWSLQKLQNTFKSGFKFRKDMISFSTNVIDVKYIIEMSEHKWWILYSCVIFAIISFLLSHSLALDFQNFTSVLYNKGFGKFICFLPL